VDDLQDIGELETYIAQSGAVVLFLTRGYMLSKIAFGRCRHLSI
jgi:hypothetical protein